MTPTFVFRPLTRQDIPLMHRWLNLPHVAQWWRNGALLENVAKEYGEYIDGVEPIRCFIVVRDGVDIGHVQFMKYGDYPDYARILGIEDKAHAANCDVFIGDPALVHHGLGAALVRQFTREIIFAEPGVTTCFIDPEPANAAAIRCYEKAGFSFVRKVDADPEGDPIYLMEMKK